jgi:hypothetical protein
MGLKVRLGLAVSGLFLSSMFGVNMLAGIKVCICIINISTFLLYCAQQQLLIFPTSTVQTVRCKQIDKIELHF